MGLDVTVVGSGDASFRFGAYSAVMRFKVTLIQTLYGKALADKYRKVMAQPPPFLFGEGGDSAKVEAMMKLVAPDMFISSGDKAKVMQLVRALDINLFIETSDCDQTFSRKECRDLYQLFKKHAHKCTARKTDREFASHYQQLMKAWKIGGGSKEDDEKEDGVIFC